MQLVALCLYCRFSETPSALIFPTFPPTSGVERQICDDIMKKAEEERLAAEAAAAAALEARAAAGPSNEKKKLDETNDALATESPVKVVTLVEGPPAAWKVGPTGSILKRSLSTSMNNSSKQTSKRSTRK